MQNKITRREFTKNSMMAAVGGAVVAGHVSQTLAADDAPSANGAADSPAEDAPVAMPGTWTAKIGNLELSRLMLGGNLIAGYAHGRGMPYVNTLMNRYNTTEKVIETLELAAQQGINSINTCAWDNVGALRKYWEKHGRDFKWIVSANPSPMSDNPFEQIDKAAADGADVLYMQGACGDALVSQKNMDMMKRAVERMRSKGVPIGIGAHMLEVIVECEKAKLDVDFYQKTLHTRDYPTAQRPEETGPFGSCDNAWCSNADEVIDFMKTVTKPWIAFKVMAAGGILPRKAFPHAINGGADFVLAGMFDWQIEEDVKIMKKALAEAKRTRPWRA